MHPHWIKLLGLSALTAGILAASAGARADETSATSAAPNFKAEPCCNLCPAAHDAKNYVTRYQQNFTTLVQAQGDWLFRTQEDLRTEFNTTPEATAASSSCTKPSRARAWNWWWSISRPAAW